MKKLFLMIVLAVTFFSASGQHYNQYCNSLYSFCLDIPGSYTRIGETETGTGQHFTAKDGSSIAVYGLPNEPDETLQQRFDREVAALSGKKTVGTSKEKPAIELAEMQENCYILVYKKNGYTQNVYRRLENNLWKNVEMICPATTTEDYKEQVKRMVASMK